MQRIPELSRRSKTAGVLNKASDLQVENYQNIEVIDNHDGSKTQISLINYKQMWQDVLELLQNHVVQKSSSHVIEIGEVILYMLSFYPQKFTSKELADRAKAYAIELQNYELIDICVAVKKLVNTSKYAPSLADIRDNLPWHCKELYRMLAVVTNLIRLAKIKKEIKHIPTQNQIDSAIVELGDIVNRVNKIAAQKRTIKGGVHGQKSQSTTKV